MNKDFIFMFIKSIFSFLLFCFSFSAFGQETSLKEICLYEILDPNEDFKKFLHEKIVLRGFVYEDDSGNFFLASEPNLSSCCIGKGLLKDSQVKLLGVNRLPEKKDHVTSVEGFLKKEDLFFVLEESSYLAFPNRHGKEVFFVISSAVGLTFLFLWMKKRRERKRTPFSLEGEPTVF